MIAATALAVAASGPLVTNSPARALPPYPAADGTVNIPATQLLTTTLAMSPNPTPGICDGSTSEGYRWQTFISDVANDPGQILYSADTGATAAVGFTSSLLDGAGNFVMNESTSGAGTVTPIPGFDLSSFGPLSLAPGQYNIGFACSLLGQTTNFWYQTITVTATDYTVGIIVRPVLISLTADVGTLEAEFFQPPGSNPAVTGYTVTATPEGGGTPVTVSGAASPITVSGLINGTIYYVEVTSSSSTFSASEPSNVIAGLPGVQSQGPVQNLQAIPAAESCAASWNPPAPPSAAVPVPTSYTVEASGDFGIPVVGSPFTVTTTDLELVGLEAGQEYFLTVTPNYLPPDFGDQANVQCIPTAAQFIIQEVSVVRPPGALILTQRCGVYGELTAFAGTNAFPGFVTDVAQGGIALPALPDNGAFPGTSPTLGPDGTGGVDPEFGVYPNPAPASYPTYCDLDLGTATLVTQGDIAGYYQAQGRLSQVSVLDTRDGDQGWGVTGEMSSFDDGFGVGFEGSYLGWDPEVADVTVTAGYTQVVTPGPVVLPGTGIPGNTGLGDGETLATALPGQGLGVAILDARILLLIPPTVPAGTYEGDLTLSFL